MIVRTLTTRLQSTRDGNTSIGKRGGSRSAERCGQQQEMVSSDGWKTKLMTQNHDLL